LFVPVVHRPSRLRLLVLAAVATLVAGLSVSGPPTARAEEAPQTVVGELVQVWPEYEHPEEAVQSHDAGPLSWIATSDGDAVRVPTEDLGRLGDAPAGATVSVTVGGEVVDELATADGVEPAREVLRAEVVSPALAESQPAPAPSIVGLTHRVTVVMVRPGGAAADSRTLQQVVDAVNGPVATFWAGQSDGAIKLGVSASHDWRTTTATCSTPLELWNEVAGQVGWSRAAGEHLMLYVPSTLTSCSYGIAEVGTGLNGGGRLYVRDVAASLIAHELGHNFSLGHASEIQCSGRVDTGSCQLTAYNDWYDVMGVSWEQIGSLNAPHAARLDLLPADERVQVNTWSPAASYVLAPASAASGLRAVELVDPHGVRYWLEYRQAGGQDAWLSTTANWPALDEGVTLRRGAGGADTSLLLDGTPSSASAFGSDRQVAFPPGRTVPVHGGDFTVTVDNLTSGGAAVRVSPGATPVGVKYAELGGPATLGAPTRTEYCGLPNGGCFRTYENGSIYWSGATGARTVAAGSVRSRWSTLSWERGLLGYPVTDTSCGLRDGGCYQHFQGGSLYSSPSSGTVFVRGGIRARWAASGWENGPLGYPVTDERCGLRDGGCFQHYQAGSVYWSPASGARMVTGAQRSRWSSLAWERGLLGYPVTDTVCGLRDGGCYQHFQGGSLYYSATSGTVFVRGGIRARWAASGWENGPLGYPVTDERCGLRDGGCFQHYQAGSVYWSPATGARGVSGPIRSAWAAGGWERGTLGYPTEEARAVPGGQAQRFQGGTLTYVSSTGEVRRS
jgi:hypothetical protein